MKILCSLLSLYFFIFDLTSSYELIAGSPKGKKGKVTIYRLHGESFFDTAIRISQDLRLQHNHQHRECKDDQYCLAQIIEDDMLKSYKGCELGLLSSYVEYTDEYGNIIKCHNDPFCISAKKSFFKHDDTLSEYIDENNILKSDPESLYCFNLRTEVIRYNFYIISGQINQIKTSVETSEDSKVSNNLKIHLQNQNTRLKFINYQINKFMDNEDIENNNIQFITNEPDEVFINKELDWSQERDGGSSPMTLAEISCNYKHYNALKSIVENKIPISIIMEDGISFKKSVSESIREYLSELQSSSKEWDIIFDSDIWDLKPEGPLFNHQRMYYKSPHVTFNNCTGWYDNDENEGPCIPTIHGASKGANFYILKLNTARILLEHFFEFPHVIDHKLNALILRYQLNSYWAEPPNVRKVRRFAGSNSAINCEDKCGKGRNEEEMVESKECKMCKIRLSDKMAQHWK